MPSGHRRCPRFPHLWLPSACLNQGPSRFKMLELIRQNRLAMCFTRAFAGLGLAIASPASFGIIGTSIQHEPARTIVFAMFGMGGPIGGALGQLLGGAMSTTGV